jgi:hypothetical protein
MSSKQTTAGFKSITLALLSIVCLLSGSAIANHSNEAYAIKQFKVRVLLNQDPINRGDTEKIKVTVKDQSTNSAISNALAKLTVTSPIGDSDTASARTNSNGQTTFNVNIDPHAKTGTYHLQVKVSKSGYQTSTVNTTFDVVKSSNDSNDSSSSSSSSSSNGSSSSNISVSAVPTSASSSASATIEQSNSQKAVCISGSTTLASCDETAVNSNTGNAVAANVGGGTSGSGSGSSHHTSQSSSAVIKQENSQKAVCISGSDTSGSCNQAASNTNAGNALSANTGGGGGSGGSGSSHQSARAKISQENSQRSVCISGSDTSGSCNQAASNTNAGNALSANTGGGGGSGGSGSQSARAGINQKNNQNSVCISGSTTSLSCNSAATNTNTGNSVGANVGSDGSGSGSTSHPHTSQSANAKISQENNQKSVCISGSGTTGSCNQAATNTNRGNTVAANVK